MNETKINYDRDADVLYVSFGRSEHVTGVELTDNVLLRLDTGKQSGGTARAIGLTFVSFSHLMAAHRDTPLTISLLNLRNLPEDIWRAVLTVVTTAPVSDFLSVNLSISPHISPLPELILG
ncbi:MAG: DUF2283 domain-containing protein [Caldilineaceae bacterium]